MTRKTAFALIEWLVAASFLFLFFRLELNPIGLFRSADEAHALSEKSYHYGPSTVARKVVVPFDSRQIVYLGTYKDWFSADTVAKRSYGWEPHGGVGGVEIDRTQGLSYSWEISQRNKSNRLAKFYGYVSDPAIKTVMLKTKETVLLQEVPEDRMFLFLWNDADQSRVLLSILGLDNSGKTVYEKALN